MKAKDEPDNKQDQSAIFKNVSSVQLPAGLSGNTLKICSADFDKDGADDLVLAIQSHPNLVLINNGNGSFPAEAAIILSARPYNSKAVSIADFNGDTYPDIVFASAGTHAHELYINNSDGSFSDLSNRIPIAGNATSVIAADVNNNGINDIIFGTLLQNAVLINNGNSLFTNESTRRIPPRQTPTRDIGFADMNGDGFGDLIFANDYVNRLLINNGSGFFADQTEGRIPFTGVIYETRTVEAEDVNGDGNLDIFFANAGTQKVQLLINSGQGIFSDQTQERLPTLASNKRAVDFADLDNDGDADIIIGSDDGLNILINDGSGHFTNETESWIPENFSPFVNDIEVNDFNADNRPDMYIAVRKGMDQLLLQK